MQNDAITSSLVKTCVFRQRNLEYFISPLFFQNKFACTSKCE